MTAAAQRHHFEVIGEVLNSTHKGCGLRFCRVSNNYHAIVGLGTKLQHDGIGIQSRVRPLLRSLEVGGAHKQAQK